MAAVVDDPAGPTLYRVSGRPPFPEPDNPALPPDIMARQVTLRDRQTVATIVPLVSRELVPRSLCGYLCDQINKEIEGGDTYPMMDTFDDDGFARYWFQSFGAVMLLGDTSGDALSEDRDWAKECLGSFCVKPNYPGRSSHVCTASFLVTDASRNRGVGRLMGECYIDWAPRLGYTYSVFNLVYETNVASCKIWDALGFKRIGRVKGCGNLRSHPDQLIDAIIYGRDLPGGEGEELVSEERFDKIKFYLKYGKYPNGADRAEKSRLRSAATHYKLLEGDKLMLKDKEVVSDPGLQYEIARTVHVAHHGGINKTTATIAEKYHWSRIKETVSDVIRACVECQELGKTPNPGGTRRNAGTITTTATANKTRAVGSSTTIPIGTNTMATMPDGGALDGQQGAANGIVEGRRVLALHGHSNILPSLAQQTSTPSPGPYANLNDISVIEPSHTLQSTQENGGMEDHHQPHEAQHHAPGHHHPHPHHHNPMLQDQPSDHKSPVYQPIDPQIINHHTHGPHDNPFDHYHQHADFQALLNATDDVVVSGHQESDAVDRDLEMLIDHHDDEDDIDMVGGGRKAEQRHRDLYDVGFDGGG